LVAAYLVPLTLTSQGYARNIVKNPGEHPRYSVELEPHFVLDWAGAPGPDAEGYGAGFRASIPYLQNGPVSTINNNMAITFGFDWSHAERPCGPWRAGWTHDCKINSFWFPVALQWNFFLTEIINVFAEPGLAIVHYRWDYWDRCWAPGYCDPDGARTRVQPVLWAGARFLLNDSIGITVRLGYPSISAGLSFLL
jgi:hypothetical protein